MKPRKFEIVECPRCGREYLAAEIFVGNAFFGKPRDIVRDVYGHILDFEGTPLDGNESYICDTCNSLFQVKTRITFITETTKLDNFDEEYSSPLKNTLFEE